MATYPRRTTGAIKDALHSKTPFRAEHGPEGVFRFCSAVRLQMHSSVAAVDANLLKRDARKFVKELKL